MFGVDEAGKGPVLGPMVVAGIEGPHESIPAGVKDSKSTSTKKREQLADELLSAPDVRVVTLSVPPEQIDSKNTNLVVVDAHASVIDALNEKQGVVDASDVREDRFEENVISSCKRDVNVTARHGADESNTWVSAASIIAKTNRDSYMRSLSSQFEREVGSGYPSDNTTREFLKEYIRETGDAPPGARKSWSTIDDLLKDA